MRCHQELDEKDADDERLAMQQLNARRKAGGGKKGAAKKSGSDSDDDWAPKANARPKVKGGIVSVSVDSALIEERRSVRWLQSVPRLLKRQSPKLHS